MGVIEEGSERVHVGAATAAAGDDLVVLDGDVVFVVVQGGVGLDDEGEGELGFFEQGCGGRHGV